MKTEELKNGFLITNIAAAADGGSLFLECTTEQNSKFNLLFTQHAFLDNPDPEMLPGRIYLNRKLVDLKSEGEKAILTGMTKFTVSHELLETDSDLKSDLTETINELRDFFNSDLSIEIKKKVDNNSSGK